MRAGDGDWLLTTLGAVVVPQKGREVPTPDSALPFIGMEHVESNTGRIANFGASADIHSASPLVVEGDVLYGRLRPYLNKVAIAPARAYTSGEFIVFRGNAQVDARFLRSRFAAQDFVDFACALNTGDRPRVKWPQMANFVLLLPPLDEQRRIVDILEDHLPRLDAAADSLARARTGLDDLLSLAAEAAYRGTSFADAGESHSVPGLPPSNKVRKRIIEPAYSPPFELAEGRRWCSVDAAATLVTDGDHNPPRRVPSGIPHVTAKGIRNGQIVFDGCTYVSEEGFEQTSRRYAALPGDVLVTCVGTIGRVAVVPDGIRFSADRNLAAIRPNDSFVSSEFLALCLNSVSLQQRMRHVSGSTAQPHLYLKDLRGLPLAVPDAATQVKVVGAARDLRSGVMRQLDEIASQETRAHLLRRSLMSAAFSGRLTGRATDMEMVEEMAGV